MISSESEWEDPDARGEALRRRVVPEESVRINRPAPQADDVEEEEDEFDFDLFGPLTPRPPRPPPEEITAAMMEEKLELERKQEMAWAKWSEENVKENEHWWLNRYEIAASRFRDMWMADYSKYASFDDITEIKPMRYTDKPAPSTCWVMYCNTVQVFSVKVAGIRGGLQWPLDVFGIVAVRDEIDQKRNIIFHRERDDSQMLTEEDPYLVLTGPTRAVVMRDEVTFEVELKVKGTTKLEDKDLSSLADPIQNPRTLYPWLLYCDYTSKLSTVEIAVGHIVRSVEATIFVQIIDGSWPARSRCQFAARSTSTTLMDIRDDIDGKELMTTDDIDRKEVILLDSRDEKVPLGVDGIVDLSRCVVSVEFTGKLVVSVKAWESGEETSTAKNKGSYLEKEVVFTPKEADRSKATLDIGFCKMEVTVAWSLILDQPLLPF